MIDRITNMLSRQWRMACQFRQDDKIRRYDRIIGWVQDFKKPLSEYGYGIRVEMYPSRCRLHLVDLTQSPWSKHHNRPPTRCLEFAQKDGSIFLTDHTGQTPNCDYGDVLSSITGWLKHEIWSDDYDRQQSKPCVRTLKQMKSAVIRDSFSEAPAAQEHWYPYG